MPTTDRTTIKATVDALIAKLGGNLVAEPPTVDRPFRSVVVGRVDAAAHPRPFVTVAVTTFRPVATVDGDRLFEVALEVAVLADVVDERPHAAMLDLVAVVEDYMDSIVDSGVIDGATGFDGREWRLDYPRTTAGVRSASATSMQTVVVRVERSFNREPAA